MILLNIALKYFSIKIVNKKIRFKKVETDFLL